MYKIKKLVLDKNPIILTRPVLPSDTKIDIKEKNSKQFINLYDVLLFVTVEKNNKNIEFSLLANKGYIFDGATIPFNIGKGNMKLLVPALFHDIMCERKNIVFYERNLSSLVFRELLLLCKVNIFKTYFMYIAVDNYQRFCRGWRKR